MEGHVSISPPNPDQTHAPRWPGSLKEAPSNVLYTYAPSNVLYASVIMMMTVVEHGGFAMSAPVTDTNSAFPKMKRNTLYHGVDIQERFNAAVVKEWLDRDAQVYKHELIDALLLLAISNRDQLPAYLAQLRHDRQKAAQLEASSNLVEEGDAR